MRKVKILKINKLILITTTPIIIITVILTPITKIN